MKTPYEKMQDFDPIISQAYDLLYALQNAGQHVLAEDAKILIRRISTAQSSAITEWQQSNMIMNGTFAKTSKTWSEMK